MVIGGFVATWFAERIGRRPVQFGMHSIAGLYYPVAIRARGGGVATSVAKKGAVIGPIAIGQALVAGLAPQTTDALLAVRPAIVLASVLGIAAVLARRA